MSENIQQIQASFNAVEDRILLKLHTGQQSLQAWITRRYLKLLIPSLQGQHPQSKQPLFSPKKQALVEMSNQKVQQEGNYEAPYQEPETVAHPLGDAPILLAKITFKALESDNPQIILEPEQGAGIVLSYQPQLTGALMKILNHAIENADWALELDPIFNVPDKVVLQ